MASEAHEPPARAPTGIAAAAGRGAAHGRGTAARLGARAAPWVSLTAAWALVGLVAGLAAAITLPGAFGYKPLTILSGSMEPALRTGGVAVDEMIRPEQARIGDIVSFTDPDHRGRLITHRLESIRLDGTTAYMVTRGDANDAPERWHVSRDTEIGRVVYHIPMLGYIRSWISGRIAILGMLVAVGCLALWMLIDIWRIPAETKTSSS